MTKIEKCTKCGGAIKDMFYDGLCNHCYMVSAKVNKPIEIDMINEPPHYTKGGIEPIDYIIANKLSFPEGNVVKYVTRYKYKNGVEDLKKARFYLNKLIENEESGTESIGD